MNIDKISEFVYNAGMSNSKYEYLRIYVYWTNSSKKIAWKGPRSGVGLLKVGQTSDIDAETRVRQQFQGAIQELTTEDAIDIIIDTEAINKDGKYFTDSDVHKILKRMGVYRIPGTEWFEATPVEIIQALEVCINNPEELTRRRSDKLKDNAKNRGVTVNKELMSRDIAVINNFRNIITTMIKHEDATTLVKIARYMVGDYNIKAFAESTVSIKLGPLMKQLIESGHVVNNGTHNFPNLKVVKTEIFEDTPLPQHGTVSTKELIELINGSKHGYLLSELVEKTNARKESIHSRLTEKRVQKVKVKTHSDYNGYEVRYFGLGKEIILPENEIFYTDKTIEKPVCIKDVNWPEYVEHIIKEHKDGVTFVDVRKEVPISKTGLYKIIAKLVKNNICIRMSTGNPLKKNEGVKNIYIHVDHLHPEVLTERVKKFDKKFIKFLLKSGVSDYTVLDIIKEHPGLHNENIKEYLHEINPTVAVSSWATIVSRITKLLESEKVIVNEGGLMSPNWYIVSKEHPYHKPPVIDYIEVEKVLQKETCGLTVLEILSKLKNPLINKVTLLLGLKMNKRFECLLCSDGCKRPYYRVYLAGKQFYKAPENEVIVDYIR